MPEARTRFQQIVRSLSVTPQITVVVEAGRALAAIVPVDMTQPCEHVVAAAPSVAAGWLRRMERVTADQRRQHALEISELVQALDEVWELMDKVRPAGADRHVDALRAAHAEVRRAR